MITIPIVGAKSTFKGHEVEDVSKELAVNLNTGKLFHKNQNKEEKAIPSPLPKSSPIIFHNFFQPDFFKCQLSVLWWCWMLFSHPNFLLAKFARSFNLTLSWLLDHFSVSVKLSHFLLYNTNITYVSLNLTYTDKLSYLWSVSLTLNFKLKIYK